jgi:hypothetical protein
MGYSRPRIAPPILLSRASFSNSANQPDTPGHRQSSRGGTETGKALEVDISANKNPEGHTAYHFRFSMSVQMLALFCGVGLGFLGGNREQLVNLGARIAEVEDEATTEAGETRATIESAAHPSFASTSTLATSAVGPSG